MNVEAAYRAEARYNPVTNSIVAPGGYIRLHDMPDEYEEGSVIDWLRCQLATLCCMLYTDGNLRDILMEANGRYRRAICDLVQAS